MEGDSDALRYSLEIFNGDEAHSDSIIAIVGPTATGKSSIAIELGMLLGGEVVSADSMQVYRHMNIGTAKVTADEMRGVPHHMIDIVNPDELFTVVDYVEAADRVINDIISRGHLPIIVGGTGLYVKALLEDYLFPDTGADSEFRKRMQELADREGRDHLHSLLQSIDVTTAVKLHPNDVRRVIRALEVYHLTGEPFSSHLDKQQRVRCRYSALKIGLTMPRELLYERIGRRIDAMVSRGLFDEVRNLMSLGFAPAFTAMQALGYKEFIPVFKGEMSVDEALDVLKRETRRYAKRQLSWFRQDKGIVWFDVTAYASAFSLARDIACLYAGSQSKSVET